MGESAMWRRYDLWNRAIVDVVYTPEMGGAPVYLDLDDDVLHQIAEQAEPGTSDPVLGLVSAVKPTLRLVWGPAEVFRAHLARLEDWRRSGSIEPPPVLPLLALLTLAAENMHEGGGKAANNYYGRLAQILDLTEAQIDRFTNAYRRRVRGKPTSELLWQSLNLWLDRLEGNRGLPTAEALTHAHIGLPLSQALVRATDRAKFRHMFASYGLAAHSTMSPPDIERLIGEWIGREPSPASNALRRAWLGKDRTARERIVEVARAELESWEGAERPAGDGTELTRLQARSQAVKLNCFLRTFPAPQLEIGLLAPCQQTDEIKLEVLGPRDELMDLLEFVPVTSVWLRLANADYVDAESLLAGVTRLRLPGEGEVLERRPRRLVPLRRDEMLESFVEAERVQLGEDAMLLCKAEPHLVGAVRSALGRAARPGWRCWDADLAGLPADWVLFSDVQLVSALDPRSAELELRELEVMQPIATTQLVIAGGLRLPGKVRKWSSLRPPEVRATSTVSGSLSAEISCTRSMGDDNPSPVRRSTDDAALIVDLEGLGLPDGDYEVRVTGDDKTVQRAALRLRSAAHRAIDLDRSDVSLGHRVRDGLVLDVLSAAPVDLESPAVRGSIVPDTERSLVQLETPDVPTWYQRRGERQRDLEVSQDRLRISIPDPESCMSTGAHHLVFPTFYGPGQSSGSTIEGVCKGCGIVKRAPAYYRRAKARGARKTPLAPALDVSTVSAVRSAEAIDADAIFDGLCHVGRGPAAWLEQLALQLGGSQLFMNSFVRLLEALGHVELQRDPETLRVMSWQVARPTLVGLASGGFLLTGYRSDLLVAAVTRAAESLGGEVERTGDVQGPARIVVLGVGEDGARRIGRETSKMTGERIEVVTDAATRLARLLPPLSRCFDHLSRVSMTGGRMYERWDPSVARFRRVPDTEAPGCYRVSGFARTYVIRDEEDIRAGKARRGDARIVKHLAALDAGEPLVGYDRSEHALYVPLGADLPGLYGRAAVLASGHEPQIDEAQGLLWYHAVPEPIAAHLSHLLSS